jgi:proteasome lid subunit RPN8/RPN11
VKVAAAAMRAVRAHGEEGYPHEVCGFLIGPRGRSAVTEARRARNTVTDRAHDRYEIDPKDMLRVERECEDTGMEVVGYYHSHPDHPARASVFDAERSWADAVYLIVSIEKGRMVDANAFVALKDGGPFRSEPLEEV